MMKQVIFLTLIFVCSINAIAQTLTCKVVNEKKEAVAYATFRLLNPEDKTLLYGAVSDELGKVIIEDIVNGAYLLECSFVGYEKVQSSLIISGNTDLPDIVLKEDIHQLKEVSVFANRISRKPGRLEINMLNSPLSKGKSAEAILSFLPGISTNGGLSVNGRSGTLVYIDERKVTNLMELQVLRAEDITKVEVIPVVGSEYGSEATGGIIRITLKKHESGFIGTALEFLKMTDRGFKSEAPAFVANYRYKKLGVYNMSVIGWGKYYPTDRDRTIHNIDGSTLYEENKSERKMTELMNNLTLRYDLDERRNIAFSLEFTLTKNNLKRHSEGILSSEGNLDQNSSMKGTGKNRVNDLTASLDYRFNFKHKGSRFTLKTTYQNIKDKLDNLDNYLNTTPDSSEDTYTRTDLNDIRTDIFIVIPKWRFQLNKGTVLTAGANGTYAQIKNDISVNSIPEDYLLESSSLALYADIQSNLSSNLLWAAGFRYQTDYLDYKRFGMPEADFSKNFNGFFPTLGLGYLFNAEKSRMLSLRYRYYQSFPGIGYYSNVKEIYSANSYSVGNPNLEPQHYHLAELNYSHNSIFNFVYTFKCGKDLVQVLTYTEKDNPAVSYTKPENIGRNRLHRLSVEARYSPFEWWFFKLDLEGNYESRNYEVDRFTQWYGSASLNNNFQMKNGWGGTLRAAYATQRKNGDYTLSSGVGMDVSAYKTLCNDQLTIGVNLNNLLYRPKKIITQTANGTWIRDIGHEPIREYVVNLTYTFRSGKKINTVKTLNGDKLDTSKATQK